MSGEDKGDSSDGELLGVKVDKLVEFCCALGWTADMSGLDADNQASSTISLPSAL